MFDGQTVLVCFLVVCLICYWPVVIFLGIRSIEKRNALWDEKEQTLTPAEFKRWVYERTKDIDPYG